MVVWYLLLIFSITTSNKAVQIFRKVVKSFSVPRNWGPAAAEEVDPVIIGPNLASPAQPSSGDSRQGIEETIKISCYTPTPQHTTRVYTWWFNSTKMFCFICNPWAFGESDLWSWSFLCRVRNGAKVREEILNSTLDIIPRPWMKNMKNAKNIPAWVFWIICCHHIIGRIGLK